MTRSLAGFRPGRIATRLHLTLLIMALAWTWTGCTAVRLATGGPGATVAPIHPGTARAAAEAVLGSPVREWTSPTGVRYATYQYDTGSRPNIPEAIAVALLDLISLGLIEYFERRDGNPTIGRNEARRTSARVVVSYDDRDVILGIFDEFAELPADGRSGRWKWR
ncbi:MAG TPA: hypothetical protein VJP78_10565 [Thermoleophilia bacterium]|nr:hypothetical protein [Thermoleophilia bacterium]